MEVEFIEQSHEILHVYGGVDTIAEAARTCYRSEPNDDGADERLVRSLIKNHHDAMLEFGYMMVRFTTDRAIANELVRHRLLSFAQESTRYVNYDNRGIAFVLPKVVAPRTIMVTDGMTSKDVTSNGITLDATMRSYVMKYCRQCAEEYEAMLKLGSTPERARMVLPLCTATTIVASGNFREWRHVFQLRCDRHAHPMMRSLMIDLLNDAIEKVPVVFDDIEVGDE